jgi:PPM family protein phosphatase
VSNDENMRARAGRRAEAQVIPSTAVLTPESGKLDVIAAVRSDVGCQRERNEDSAVFIRPADAELLSAKGVLAVVADGLGGHSAGEVASRIAVEVIRQRYFENLGSWQTALVAAVQDANAAVLERSRASDALRDMGTTCTALAVRDGTAWCAHVGDSRLYLVRDKQIYTMTENHSAVMDKVRLGVLTLEEARRHEERNVILRSLGSHADLRIDTWKEPFPVRSGDRFVLCSDGLYDLVEDSEIRTLVSEAEPCEAAHQLIALARDRTAPDNVTVAILAVQPVSQGERVKATREVGVPE